MTNKIRIGVYGLRRGMSFVRTAQAFDEAEVVALCDRDEKALTQARSKVPGAAAYHSYEDMLGTDLDAVVLCNYCPDHAPAAIQTMESGKHVLSEVIACGTVAEGVALARTVEKTKQVYMFAENYCYMAFIQEMRRLYEAGELGEFRYGEGEYVHFARDILHRIVDVNIPDHWRLWIPPTYYCTHSLGPLLRITGLRPVEVAGAVVPSSMSGWTHGLRSDFGVEIVRLNNGALVKSLHGGGCPREPWSPWYVAYGTEGVIENRRWPDSNEVTLYLDGQGEPKTYTAEFPTHKDQARESGHWGGDWFVMYEFLKSIRSGNKPDIDVYMALDMTLPGLLAWRSALNGGGFVKVPDMRREDVRKRCENDHFSPRPGTPQEFALPNTLQGFSRPSKRYLDELRKRQETEPY